MKKQLLCTSAIALGVAAASPVAAQDWDVGLGGYYVIHFGFGDFSGNTAVLNTPNANGQLPDFEGAQIFQDAEIAITPSITLDNGLTFGANIQYETADGSDLDEVYVQISSDTFGTLQWGYENSAGAQVMLGAPNVTAMPLNSPSTSGFIPLTGTGFASGSGGGFAFVDASISSFTEVAGNSDVARLNYFTPSFNGFTLGLAYAPDNQGSDGALANPDNSNPSTGVAATQRYSGTVSDIWDIGVSYEQTFGTVDVAVGARYGEGSAASGSFLLTALQTAATPGTAPITTGYLVPVTGDPSTWGIGAQVSVNGWTFGGHYAENDNGGEAGLLDSSGWSLGIAYDIPGPWSVSFTTFQSEIDGTGTITTGPAAGTSFTGNHNREAYLLGANRNLGPGVDWSVWVFYDEYTSDIGSPLNGDDIDGTVFGTSLALSF